ncbi:DUF3099 domain-containing protein [Aeromicrobium sp. IC_218]|uniref:DUF3099 domain-containing protein n=1 Tax=Aeromicrobium sp. IC_218 TaxID=2545468 RepID=UPI001039D70F|nr:DUF3099 domain-containing protein [Aeromicrobium sp. IC_218]TCJ00056.1 DUF3099 domain-containing protein [Aeromicrobium sp. IC_218]
MERSRGRRDAEVQSITSASVPHTEELDGRMKRYALSMGIRSVCFVLAVLAATWLHWLVVALLLMAAAIVLPYVAVVMANAGVRRKGAGPSPFGPEDRPQIEGPRG